MRQCGPGNGLIPGKRSLVAMRIIKYFAWEVKCSAFKYLPILLGLRQKPYMKWIAACQSKEMRCILRTFFSLSAAYALPDSFLRTRLVARGLNSAIAFLLLLTSRNNI